MNLEEIVKNLFKTPKKDLGPIDKGSIVKFFYSGTGKNIIHDPSPLVLITGNYPQELRGVNLHYLVTPELQTILNNRSMAGNKGFSYKILKFTINNNITIKRIFRSYKKIAISNEKQLDVEYLRNLLTISRALSPNELERMAEQVQMMLSRPINQPRAGEVDGGN